MQGRKNYEKLARRWYISLNNRKAPVYLSGRSYDGSFEIRNEVSRKPLCHNSAVTQGLKAHVASELSHELGVQSTTVPSSTNSTFRQYGKEVGPPRHPTPPSTTQTQPPDPQTVTLALLGIRPAPRMVPPRRKVVPGFCERPQNNNEDILLHQQRQIYFYSLFIYLFI